MALARIPRTFWLQGHRIERAAVRFYADKVETKTAVEDKATEEKTEPVPTTKDMKAADLSKKYYEPFPAFENDRNPNTGEIGGPRGPEPTRFGDWERKGRVTDF
eukprot:Colp12_sorted_trinity150504_noHs@16505